VIVLENTNQMIQVMKDHLVTIEVEETTEVQDIQETTEVQDIQEMIEVEEMTDIQEMVEIENKQL
jgi:hypothetical protein